MHCGQLEVQGRAPASGASDNGSAKNEGGTVSLQKRTQEAIGLLRAVGVPKELDWVVAEGVRAYEEMGDPSTTAQVHPYQFTTSMAALAEEKGVKVVLGSATSINHSSGVAESVSYNSQDGETHTIDADTVILTAGPWTKTIYPSAPISALRAHSVTIQPSRPVSAYALFTSITLPQAKANSKRSSARTVTPEIYARPNNEVYACGEGDTLIPLPTSTALVQVDEARCQDIVDQVHAISDELRDGEVTARQACYLPNVSRGGGPMIGETGVKGLLIGAGHTCWGIQNAPATGKCLAEIVWEGAAKSANLRTLDPRKFM